MKKNTPNHPKVRRLGRRIGGQVIAIGVLEALWHFVAQFAPTGDVGRYQDEDIADGVFWDDDPTRLIDALVNSGWLERNETHRLIVHDWPEHCEDAVHLFLARNVQLFADGTVPRFSRLSKTERPAIEQGFKQLLEEVSHVNTADTACNSALCAQETHESAQMRTPCAQKAQENTLPIPIPMPIPMPMPMPEKLRDAHGMRTRGPEPQPPPMSVKSISAD